MNQDVIFGINGPVVTVQNSRSFSMMEQVYVGNSRLVGEVIKISDQITTIQVYEETTGLRPGEPVYGTGAPMNILLGPGILDNIFDGIERPLKALEAADGAFIAKGTTVSLLDDQKEWDVTLTCKAGDRLSSGQIYATLPETPIITHKCMVPPGVEGEVIEVKPNGLYRLHDTIAVLKDGRGRIHELTLCQKWPIRNSRPIARREPPDVPLITGQRIIDTMFPIAKGGTAAIPGGFGTGKTMTQHQLAKWCDADIIIYVGCGERGNEMSQVLDEFSELVDPKSGRPMTDRTVLIANTSNMPVAAREASVYTGMTIAEYYRDMGYHVALMADSTSRWAEALREISGRLEEMPAEEGFPAYLASRLAEFYERAGYVKTLEGKEGSVTVIGAVSPQGGDFSEPVTQNTKRYVRTFWGLDRALAYARHFPSINWLTSYSEYADDLRPWYDEHVGPEFVTCRHQMAHLLQKESELMEIVKLIGADILPEDQKLIIETAKLFRVGFLQQNAYHAIDTYVPLDKQLRMMELMLKLYHGAKDIVSRAIPLSQLKETGIFESLAKMKYEVPNDGQEKFAEYDAAIEDALRQVNEANR